MKVRMFFISMITVLMMFLFIGSILESSYGQAQDRGQGVRKNTQFRKKIALVIGNSSYKESPLKNPVNDAKDMAQALRELGFSVDLQVDATREKMLEAIQNFGEKIESNSVILFYYAGHGIQSNGNNYLIPINTSITKEAQLEYLAVNAGLVLAQLEGSKDTLNLMILDACRNNPFASSLRSAGGGLAQMNAPTGTLIAYATAPGKTASDGNARNGLYTQELLKWMRKPGLKVEDVFKNVRKSVLELSNQAQLPWDASSLVGEFSFSESATSTVTATNNPNTLPGNSLENNLAGNSNTSAEQNYWNSLDKNSVGQLKAYLEEYPNGQYSKLAKAKLSDLSATKPNVTQPGISNESKPSSISTSPSTSPLDTSTNTAGSRSSNLSLAESYFKGGDYNKVVKLSEEVVKEQPNNPQANRLLGMGYFLEGKPNLGVPFIVKAVQSGEFVTFTIQHKTFKLSLDEKLTKEILILHKDKLEIQGPDNYSLPYSNLIELSESQDSNRSVNVHLKFKFIDAKERKEKTKDFNFFAPWAELYEDRSGTKVKCAKCENWSSSIVSLIRELKASK